MKKHITLLCLVASLVGLSIYKLYHTGSASQAILTATPDQAVSTPIEPNLLSTKGTSDLVTTNTAQDYYQSWVQEHEHKIWNILKPYNITRTKLANLKNSYRDAYRQHIQHAQMAIARGGKLSEDTHKLIKRVCADFKVDMDSINIVSYIDDSISPAFANDRTLFIDENLLARYPYKAQLFVLGHELSHIIHEDDSLGFIAHKAMPPYTKNASHPLNVLHRVQELRADMTAISKSAEYAEGQQEFLSIFLREQGEGMGITHPKLSTRLAMGNTMLGHYKSA